MTVFFAVVAGLVGACVGSFLNVVIWRLPRRESLVFPGSHCPRCNQEIRWFDNLPIVSWLLLRARCRRCRVPISARYPAVEALTAALFVAAALRYPGLPIPAAEIALLLAGLVAVTFIDLDHRIIPDAITKPGMVLGLILALFPPFSLHPPGWIHGLAPGLNSLLHAAAGCLTGLLVIYVVRWLGTLLFKKEAMGQGDAKLLGLIGVFLGPAGAFYALTLACLAGVLVHGLVVLLTRSRPKPLHLELQGVGGTGQPPRTFERAQVAVAPAAAGGAPQVRLEVLASETAAVGDAFRVTALLPKVRVLMDADLSVGGKAVVEAVEPRGTSWRWSLSWDGLPADDVESLELFAASHRYLPFGPYLALGGALAALLDVHGWIEAYSRWVLGR